MASITKQSNSPNEITFEKVQEYLDKNPNAMAEIFQSKATYEHVNSWLASKKDQSMFPTGGVASDSLPEMSGSRGTLLKNFRKSFTGMSGNVRNLLSPTCIGGKRKLSNKSALAKLDEKELFMELIRDIANELDLNTLCHKILMNVSILTNGDRCSLFLVRGPKDQRFLVSKLFDVTEHSTVEDSVHTAEEEIKIPFGHGIAGHVAQSKETVNIKDAYEDRRFNREVDRKTGYKTHSILCMPICNHDGEVIGVAQVMNKITGSHEFTAKDEEVFKNYLTFCGIGIINAQLFEISINEYKRNQMMLQLARGIFEEQMDLQKVVNQIMVEAMELLRCERCMVFILQTHQSSGLHSLFETSVGIRQQKPILSQEEVSFFKAFDLCYESKNEITTLSPEQVKDSVHSQMARHVATNQQTLNICDFQAQTEFKGGCPVNKEFIIKTALCMPIYNSEGVVIGIAQLLNKENGSMFSEQDETTFETFAIFCGLGIHNTQMYEKATLLMAKQKVAIEVLSYHASAQPDEINRLQSAVPNTCQDLHLYSFEFDDLQLTEEETLQATLSMMMEFDFLGKFHIPKEVMCSWLLSVRKNYRAVLYHNWRHAFNVAQTMFCMLKTGDMEHVFSDIEHMVLIVACLCHDLDHRGTNNTFQQKTASPLALLYTTSVMEHHHFDHCIMILNSENNNIFQSLSAEDYQSVLKMLESAILATDLALYFKKRNNFFEMVECGNPDWTNDDNRDLLRAMMMTACDVSAITKPWEVQQRVAEMVASEFFEQGDMERDQLNQQPIAMMDREKKDDLPKMQVGFIDAICMPVYKTFSEIWPGLKPMYDGVMNNRKNWQAISDGTKEEDVAQSSQNNQDEDIAEDMPQSTKQTDIASKKESNVTMHSGRSGHGKVSMSSQCKEALAQKNRSKMCSIV
ncbi:cGMP-specific 3',5'-cyclic phosphodiesterase-like isoform X2 [Antedon mediterranea]|uniref:cGMP-specific 3',5'-cyclic phosphodiesterase-like isoform X2 n=1 Tax=Antedon mediterranea TaxID=105859 RepID=UPI003AF6A044